ncbi:MAG: DUF3450 family protein [Campylobacterota bacterium]|nr:DUF3450 family protein [Campylobacterota bacterium]
MITTHKKMLLSLAVATTLFSTSLQAQSNEDLINNIMKLRGDVESLYTQIDENRDFYKSQMKSLAMQHADSEAQINRHNTSIKLAQSELSKIEAKIAVTSSNDVELKPLLLNAINLLKKSIVTGIPFKVNERIADLKKIEKELAEKEITEEKALALIWALYDDNIRLTKEIGLFKQKININGEKILAKVAKIGSIMIYFKAPDERVGYVVQNDDGYGYKVITNPEDIKKINTLFDALQKQIRTGYFTLPNALILMETK